MADGSITTLKVADGNITSVKLASGLNLGGTTTGSFSGPLAGNATTATSATSAISFTGALSGDVTGTQGATAIAATTVTGKLLTGFASGAGTVSAGDTVLGAINKLDGNLSATGAALASRAPLASPTFTGTVTAPNFSGNGSGLTGLSVADGSITTLKLADGNITSVKLASGLTLGGTTIGAFSGPLSGNVTGNVSGSAASFTGNLAGEVSGPQGATVVVAVGGVTAANVATGANLANAATNANTAGALVRRDASGNFTAGTVTAGGLTTPGLLTLSSTNAAGTRRCHHAERPAAPHLRDRQRLSRERRGQLRDERHQQHGHRCLCAHQQHGRLQEHGHRP